MEKIELPDEQIQTNPRKVCILSKQTASFEAMKDARTNKLNPR